MRTFSPMLTISIDLGLNQLGLHGGKNGFALGQSQTDRLWRRRICRSAAGKCVCTCPFASVSSSKTRDFIPLPRSITTRNQYHPQI